MTCIPLGMDSPSAWAKDRLYHDGVFMDDAVFEMLASALAWGTIPLVTEFSRRSRV
jgi:hypothetical protein